MRPPWGAEGVRRTGMMRSQMLLLTTCLALGSACDGDGATDAPEDLGGMIQRTVVVRNADGTETVKQLNISREQNEREIEARKLLLDGKLTPAVVQDGSCAGSSMWLYSAINRGGSQLCFYQNNAPHTWEFVNLGSYGWAASVRSFWGGSQDSYFNKTVSPFCGEAYPSYTLQNSGTACVQSANSMGLCSVTGGCL
jgi:hypothetical protein